MGKGLELNTFKADLNAGFSVALVALPLSIGISLASGAPASSGLIAAIIGGLIGSWLGGTQMTINGPAAGLIVIVLEAILTLGHGDSVQGFKGMLAASVVAGAFQILFGALKFGRKGSAFPASVIHGMMAAIGLIIIAKQAHVLLGYAPIAKNPIMLFSEIPQAFFNLQPSIFGLGFSSLALLMLWPRLPWQFTKKIPAPLITVIFGAFGAHFIQLSPSALLNIPSDLGQWIIFPDFSVMQTFDGWRAAITLALVASLETTLSASAIGKLDPMNRKCNLDRDLLSKGVCNMLSGSIGGLPMIAEIVRSSANVGYKAKTWKSNFLHGVIVLFAVLALPSVLSLIPLASLAAILLLVGSRLGSPSHFMHALKVGKDNLVGFLVTMVVTLAVDLLVGIFAGAVAQYLVEMYLGLKIKHTFKPSYDEKLTNLNVEVFTVESSLIFSNFVSLKEEILKMKKLRRNVKLVLVGCEYIDHSVMDQISELKHDFELCSLNFETELSKEHHSLGEDLLSSQKKSA